MISEADVKAKLKEILDYSMSQNDGYREFCPDLMAPLETAVSEYFSTPNPSMSKALKDCVFYLFCDAKILIIRMFCKNASGDE